MEAIILAGGVGSRLRPVVPEKPKPLAPVAGRPFIEWVLENLARNGFSQVVLSVGYRHDAIQAALGSSFSGIAIRYAVEREPLGTGGAIRFAADACTDQDVFVLNGDTYAEFDFPAMYEFHCTGRSRLTIGIADVLDSNRFGRVLTDGERVAGFTEKGSTGPGQINAGVYVMRRGLLDCHSLPKAFSFEQEILVKRRGELEPRWYRARGPFIDIGVPEDYARAQNFFATQWPR